MRYFKLTIVIATAVFLTFHTQIFIAGIEPNPAFSWLASILVEAMIIALAMQVRQRRVSLIFLVPLYVISVVAAAASFVVSNETELEKMLTQKQQVEILSEDLKATQQAYQYGQKYTTKTMERERRLRDLMLQVSAQAGGRIAVGKAVVFLFLVITLQGVSIYLASTVFVKQGTLETLETVKQQGGETVKTTDEDALKAQIAELRKQGFSYRQIAAETDIPVSKIYRFLKTKNA